MPLSAAIDCRMSAASSEVRRCSGNREASRRNDAVNAVVAVASNQLGIVKIESLVITTTD
jgi:hypothetical protein